MTTVKTSIIAAGCLAGLIAAGVTLGLRIHSAAPQHAACTPQVRPAAADHNVVTPGTLRERGARLFNTEADRLYRENLREHEAHVAGLRQAAQDQQAHARWAFARAERDRYIRGVVVALRYRREQWDSLWPDPPREPGYYDLPVTCPLLPPPDRHDK